MPILSAESITAGYGSVPIVQSVSMTVDAGQVVAIVGPNGAGKSTFLKGIFGLIRKTEGTVTVDGHDVTNLAAYQIAQNGISYVPQVENIFPSLTIVENLEMGAYISKKDGGARVAEVLDIFPDLAKSPQAKGGNLSGGQKNMLAMARGLMLNPHVILLDEPTAGLSPAYTQVVWRQIQRIAESGAGVLVVEQNVELALVHSDYVHVLVAGRNHTQGPAAEVQLMNLGAIFLGEDIQRSNPQQP